MNLPKKDLLLIIFAAGLLSIILFLAFYTLSNLFQSQNPSPRVVTTLTPTIDISHPTESDWAGYGQVFPGRTTKKDFENLNGIPSQTESQTDSEVLLYTLPNTTRVNKIYIRNNKVEYISEEITKDNELYTDYIKSTNKKPDGVLYDSYNGGAGFQWYIFSRDGVAFLVNPQAGYVLQVFRFPSMDYPTYVKTVAVKFNQLKFNPELTPEIFH